MRVYLIAAPEDEAEGEKLAEYLKRFGVFIRSEYGKLAYPPAHHGEFTLALWSRNAMMSSRQMMLTNRAIDAWAEGQLVMARLDPGLNPRGLSDLDMVDLGMPSMREHRYHDVLNALRAMQDAQRRARVAPPSVSAPPGGSGGSGPDDTGEELERRAPEGSKSIRTMREAQARANEIEDSDMAVSEEEFADRDLTAEVRIPPPEVQAKSSGGGSLFVLVPAILLLVFSVIVLSNSLGPLPDLSMAGRGELSGVYRIALWVVSGLGILIALGGIIHVLRRASSTRKPAKAAPAPVAQPAPQSAASAEPEPVPAPEPEPDDTPEVFVSYSHSNADMVLPIVASVEDRGVSIWIDREEMRAGQTWAGQIVRAIKSAERFCLMCSAQAFESDHVRREVYLADKYGKDMLPVRLDGAEMPEDIEYFLIGRQWIDLTDLSESERAQAIHGALSSRET